MLLAQVSDFQRYNYQDSKFQSILTFIGSKEYEKYQPGTKVQVCDGVVAVIREPYKTVPEDTIQFETHAYHYDVHYLIEGEEKIGIVPAADLKPATDYNAERDIRYFEEPEKSGAIILHAGELCAVSPDDAHKPECCVDHPILVRKIVFKVEV